MHQSPYKTRADLLNRGPRKRQAIFILCDLFHIVHCTKQILICKFKRIQTQSTARNSFSGFLCVKTNSQTLLPCEPCNDILYLILLTCLPCNGIFCIWTEPEISAPWQAYTVSQTPPPRRPWLSTESSWSVSPD